MTETPGRNPYRPGVGVRPVYLAGRDPSIARFRAMLRAAPELQASMRVTGLRGVGKTVLLDVFAEKARTASWEPAKLELQPSHNTNESLEAVLSDLLDRTRRRLSRIGSTRFAC